MWTMWTGVLWIAFCVVPANAGSVVTALGRDQGLPSSQVQDLAFHDGTVWMATPVGLAAWDGVMVRVESKESGLSSQGLRSVAVTAEGLWIGSDRGLDLRPAEKKTHAVTPSTWDAGFVNRVLPLNEGVLIGSAKGLYWASSSGDLEPVEQVPQELVTDLTRASDGAIWAVGPNLGVWRHANGNWISFSSAKSDHEGPLVTLAPSGDATVWAGGAAGLWRINAQGRVVDFIRAESTTAVLEHRDELWVGSRGALNRYGKSGGEWTLNEATRDVFANRLLLDAGGNLWVATDARGLLKISMLRFSIQTVANPCATQVFSLRRSDSGQVLVGGLDCSWRLSPDLQKAHRIAGLDGSRVWDLLEVDGQLWAATQGGLLAGSESTVFKSVPGAPDAAFAPCRALLSRRDEVWLGTVDGLWSYREGTWTEARTDQGSAFSYVYTLELDSASRLWIGTIGDGVWRERTPNHFEQISGPGLDPQGNAYAISTTDQGQWILSDDHLVQIDSDDRPRVVLTQEDGIVGWSLIAGPDVVWVGGNQGLYEAATASDHVRWRIPSSAGPPGAEFTTSRSLMQLQDGRLLAGTAAGLAVVSPTEIGRLRPPTIRLRDLRWKGTETYSEAGRLRVPNGNWDLSIHVASGFFADELSTRYRHRLVGFSDQWSEPARAQNLPWHYTTLPSGTYRLEGQAFSPLTGWGDVAVLAEFDVDRPWWAQAPALGGWAVLLAALVAGSWRWREGRLRQRTAELERLVSRRTESLEKARKELEELAAIDPLTKIANRRTFAQRAAEQMQRAIRSGGRFSLILIDLDHFKSINDRYGHQIGDLALQHAVGVLKPRLREADVLARFGGEEFAILLEGDGLAEAGITAERLRSSLDSATLRWEGGGESLAVRGSFGCAEWRPEISFDELVRRADEALYVAKRDRNAVALWHEGQCLPTSELASRS